MASVKENLGIELFKKTAHRVERALPGHDEEPKADGRPPLLPLEQSMTDKSYLQAKPALAHGQQQEQTAQGF